MGEPQKHSDGAAARVLRGLAVQRWGPLSGCGSSPQRWGERSILRAAGQQCPRQKRRVTGPRVMPALQQQELQTA